MRSACARATRTRGMSIAVRRAPRGRATVREAQSVGEARGSSGCGAVRSLSQSRRAVRMRSCQRSASNRCGRGCSRCRGCGSVDEHQLRCCHSRGVQSSPNRETSGSHGQHCCRPAAEKSQIHLPTSPSRVEIAAHQHRRSNPPGRPPDTPTRLTTHSREEAYARRVRVETESERASLIRPCCRCR